MYSSASSRQLRRRHPAGRRRPGARRRWRRPPGAPPAARCFGSQWPKMKRSSVFSTRPLGPPAAAGHHAHVGRRAARVLATGAPAHACAGERPAKCLPSTPALAASRKRRPSRRRPQAAARRAAFSPRAGRPVVSVVGLGRALLRAGWRHPASSSALMRLRARSTSSTRTFTAWPVLTTSRASLTNLWRQLADVHQAVLVHAQVDEGAELRDVAHRAFEHHARLQVLDVFHAVVEARHDWKCGRVDRGRAFPAR